MHVPEIIAVKDRLEKLKENGLIESWELPYENLLTRLSAAIFFFTPKNEPENLNSIQEELSAYPNFNYALNEEKKLSGLKYKMTFESQN